VTFLAPGRLLWLLGVVALATAYFVLQRRRRAHPVRFSNLALIDQVAPRESRWRRHIPAAAFLATLALLVTGFARPTAEMEVAQDRATIVVAIDSSGSMRAKDIAPDRFEAAKAAARQFVSGLPPRFNVALVSFARSANVAVPPTTDRDLVRRGIDGLQVAGGTAVGEAIFTSLEAIAQLDERAEEVPPPSAIVLLGDGAQTEGRPAEAAARAAAEAGVPVHTVAYGTADGVLPSRTGPAPVPVDGGLLRSIAEISGGGYYEAASAEQIRQVYNDIGTSVSYRTEQQDVSSWFIGAALLAASAAAGAAVLWFPRLP
jgi:Ca-activated chloride channel family protein